MYTRGGHPGSQGFENISRAAGAAHGQEVTASDFAAVLEPLGRTLKQRNTIYTSITDPKVSMEPTKRRIPVVAE